MLLGEVEEWCNGFFYLRALMILLIYHQLSIHPQPITFITPIQLFSLNNTIINPTSESKISRSRIWFLYSCRMWWLIVNLLYTTVEIHGEILYRILWLVDGGSGLLDDLRDRLFGDSFVIAGLKGFLNWVRDALEVFWYGFWQLIFNSSSRGYLLFARGNL